MASTSLKGVGDTISTLSKINTTAKSKIERALTMAAGEIIAESTKLTPIDTGELRSRTFVSKPVINDDGSAEIAFGYEQNDVRYISLDENGKQTDNLYSVYVHERTELHHKVGQAKFLETAVKNFEKEMLKYLAYTVKESFK